MKTTTKARSNTTANINYTNTTSDFGSFRPNAPSPRTEPLPTTLLASPSQSHHSKRENQDVKTINENSLGDNQFTPKSPPNTLIRSHTQKRVPKPSLKPIVPFGNGVKLYRNHTTNPKPSVTRSIKKSLSSDDIYRLRQDYITASWNPARQSTDRSPLSYAPHTTPLIDFYPLASSAPNPTSLLRSPDDTTPTSGFHRASLPVQFQTSFDLDTATRGTLSATKRRRTMHGAASNESIRTARPSPQQKTHEPSYPFPASRKPRFQDISIFDTFNQSAIPSYSNLPSPVGPNSPSANSLNAGRDQIGRVNAAAHQITVIAQPGDDPRFVIWGEQQHSSKSSVSVTTKRSSSIVERQQTHQSSTSSTSNLAHIGNSNSSKSSDVGDDFLQDRVLRFSLTSWLKNLIQKIKSIRQCLLEIDPKPNGKGDEDLKILKSLKKVVKQRKDVYLAYNLVSDNNDKSKTRHKDVRDVFGQGESETQARDSNLAKSDLKLNDGDASEDQATDDEDVEVDVKPEVNELPDPNSIRARYEKLKESFAQDTHEISEPESNAIDEINVKFDRAPLFISRKSTTINATLVQVPTHSMTHSSDTLDHRISHVRPIDPLGFTQQHNPLQRYFTSTMGTFGRFKRMINNRSGTVTATGPYSSMTDSSRFNDHMESNGEVCDLLCAKGGLERFMSFFEGDHRLEQNGPERLEEIAEDKELRYSRRFETEECPPSFEKTNLEYERLSMEDTGKYSIEIEKTSSEIDRGHLSSPLIQDDEDGFESQLSLSSSTSNTSYTTSSQPGSSDEKGTEGLVALVGSEAIEYLDGNPASLALSFGMVQDEKDEIDARRFGSRPQSLHESLSTETIKSESNRTSKGVGTGLFKKQIKKRFANQNLGSMRILGFESRQSLSLDRNSMSMGRNSMSLDRPSLSVDGGRESSSSRDNLSLRSGRSGTTPQDISVQLDDLDLSDEDGSDSDQHNENHRPLRRLRAAGDLKEAINSTRRSFFAQLKPSLRLRVNSGVRLSTETSSSIGTRRVPSIAGSIFRKSKLGDSVTSLPDTLNSLQDGTEARGEDEDEDEAGGMGVVANFVAEGLDSDEDEPGDVEAALRRLEGVIDADREREKARKVERQMMKSLEASRTGNRSRSSTIDSHRTFSSSASSLAVVTDEEEEQGEEEEEGQEEEGEMEMIDGEHDLSVDKTSTSTVPEITFDHVAERDSGGQEGHRSSEEQSSRPKFMNSSKESVNSNVGGGNELWKRKHKTPTASELNSNQQAMDRKVALHKRFVGGGALSRPISLFGGVGGAQPPIHRSFLLDFRTEILAQQFALIERDLLRKITWQELLMSRWQENGRNGSSNDTNCWTSYMKQRVIEGKSKSDNVRGLIVRFNLTCNWVASELVMTVGLEERKCYRQNNFQTLTQIIHGLQTPYITRLKRTWAKLGIWESRMFRDLKEFTSHGANFKSLRLVQDQLVEGIESVGGPTGITTTPGGHDERVRVVGCIPFLGLYLRDLTINDELPTYLNPNEPSIGVPIIDRESGFVEGTNLYPLVNIHKFRIYSKVVNKIIGFQELSLSYPFEAQGDQSLFLNCLRLKSLDSSRLRWLSDVCEGQKE
ncbi:uncharacterized protein MELLADRAFT_78647 [Melampsora larici-populina 98AG31]|uniref:Ras-GEF domain-containing protein n=1 Tax=Melampsora larici-populina (strain 98AG31 / pathotype 3-4-7) TaxID=747676 RepID=F4RWT5_MELLP|nr:uncharacterized protein MELLADRAFT_78647 [Melampsora larici-populina 98AG31]EGG03082.1 hypothetical protein MELLADRAFT_78647 [Melampsora larici-populina 98AG31]